MFQYLIVAQKDAEWELSHSLWLQRDHEVLKGFSKKIINSLFDVYIPYHVDFKQVKVLFDVDPI